MGALVYVYRCDLGDCTCNGISATASQLFVTNVEGFWAAPPPGVPAARLVAHDHYKDHAILVPEGTDGGMHGGNYGGSSGGPGWCKAVEAITGKKHVHLVPIHDRFERGAP